jgi:hypothetical protein
MKLIYRYKILTIVILSIFNTNVFSQNKVQNLPYEDLKPLHFGFLVGLHSQDLVFDHSGIPDAEGNKWYGSIPSYTPGFTVGGLVDFRLSENLSLRLVPGIHFGSKEVLLVSDAAGADAIKAPVRSNYVTLPVNLRFRGARTDNYRPYLMCGFSGGLDVGRDKNVPLLLETINTYLEIGAGCDLYLPFFRLVPEIKFCIGMGDILVHERDDQGSEIYLKYSGAFDKITSRLVVFSLQFE